MRPRLPRPLLAALAAAAALAAPGVAEAATWCGTPAGHDRPAVVAGPHIRVVYALPADGPDRSAELAPELWADVEEMTAWWAANDASRTPNFDLAPFACGSQVDLTFKRLARPAAELAAGDSRFVRIRDELFSDPLLDVRHSKYLVYYDGPANEANLCGEGAGSPTGTGLAILYLGACTNVTRAPVAAHELLHALGALRGITAPNACPGNTAHVCDSTGDILYPFAQPLPLSSFVLDAGRDDYYAHGRPWFDVQTSAWLRRLDVRVPLQVTVRGGGTVRTDVPAPSCAGVCRTDWNPGSEILLIAEAPRGRRFVGWSGACTGPSPHCALGLDDAAATTALFAPATYRLGLQVAGRGRITGAGAACTVARCVRDLLSHRSVRLRATPAPGWRLRAWSGACRGAGATCTVPMTKAATVRATFARR
ncbi:MAG TPA: hypothetical protein VM204_08715 [Gaiellaceae bacterium]|nr:hypothetical protein [Gaiellaceae bacterium]